MRWCWLVFLWLAPATHPATRPAGHPATRPASAPSNLQTLDHGAVSFNLPQDWVLRGKGSDDLSIHYRTHDGSANVSIVVIVQPEPLPDSAAQAIGEALAKKLAADADAAGAEVVLAPQVEKDDRFFVKVHGQTKRNGRPIDRLDIYRREGKLLLTIVAQTSDDSPEMIHKQAEQTLLGAKVVGEKKIEDQPITIDIGKPTTAPAVPAGPTVLAKAHIRIDSPPTSGWRAKLTDATSGIVCTYRQSGGENGMIVVSIRPLPVEARNDPKLREVVVDEMVNSEQTSLKIPRSKETEKPHKLVDPRFVRKTTRKYDVDGDSYTLTSRQMVVGDSLLSVVNLAPDKQADAIDKLADTVAISTKPVGKK